VVAKKVPGFDLAEFDIAEIAENTSQPESVTVEGPSGSKYQVLNEFEADHYNNLAKRYQDDNVFINVSDVQELDRILMMELMMYRWGLWLIQEKDYDNKRINASEIQKSIATYSKEIRDIKKDLGMDKSTRDRDNGENVNAYINNLLLRAKEFGVARNNQAVTAINILMELRGIITMYRNSNDEERKEFNATMEDILEWCERKFDEFDEIDKALRESQKYWIHEVSKV